MPWCRLGEEAPSPSVILRCAFKPRPFCRFFFFILSPHPVSDAGRARFAIPAQTQGVTPWQPGHAATGWQRGPGSCWTERLALPLNVLSSAPQALGTATWKPRASPSIVSEAKRVPLHLPSHLAFESLDTLLQSFKAQGISHTLFGALHPHPFFFLSLNFAVELKGTNANNYLFFSRLLAK